MSRDPRTVATTLGLASFLLVLASFVLLGFGRLLFGFEAAIRVAGPIAALAFTLAAALFVGFSLGRAGIGPLVPEE